MLLIVTVKKNNTIILDNNDKSVKTVTSFDALFLLCEYTGIIKKKDSKDKLNKYTHLKSRTEYNDWLTMIIYNIRTR